MAGSNWELSTSDTRLAADGNDVTEAVASSTIGKVDQGRWRVVWEERNLSKALMGEGNAEAGWNKFPSHHLRHAHERRQEGDEVMIRQIVPVPGA